MLAYLLSSSCSTEWRGDDGMLVSECRYVICGWVDCLACFTISLDSNCGWRSDNRQTNKGRRLIALCYSRRGRTEMQCMGQTVSQSLGQSDSTKSADIMHNSVLLIVKFMKICCVCGYECPYLCCTYKFA